MQKAFTLLKEKVKFAKGFKERYWPKEEYQNRALRLKLLAQNYNKNENCESYEDNWIKRKRKKRFAYTYQLRFDQGQMKAMETVFESKAKTNSQGDPIHSNVARFDTDMDQIGVDNRASACISHNIGDFAVTLQKVNQTI